MWNFNFNQMKKLIYLFLMLFASVAYSQADFPEGVQISGGQPTTTTDPYLTTTGTTGLQGKVVPINIPVTITPPTTFYTPVTSDLKGHLQGIDNALGDIPLTTAGNTTRVWFTGDATTITAGTFYLTNAQNKGTVANVSQSVTNDDNQKKYFAQDLIGNAFATTTIFPPGVYAGNLSASTTPNSAQQRFTVELYRCDTNGTPIASGIAGAPVGDLGVTVILILDSGLLTLADGSVTNVQVSASLASQLTVNVGERIRYHVSAEKVGTVASNITESVWYGSSFNSFLDVPTPITSSGVTNVSTVTGATVTAALDNLNTADQAVAGAGVTYGHITDAAQTLAGVKTYVNTGATQINGLLLINNGTTGSYVLNISNTSTGYGTLYSNSSTGSGFRSNNSGSGYGIHSSNSGSGFSIYTSNSGAGVGITSNSTTSATGFNFSGRLNDVDNFTVDKNGNIFSTSIGIGTSSITNPIHVKKTALSILKDGIRVDRDPTVLSSAIFNAFGGAANIVSNSGTTSSFSPIAFFSSDGTTTNEVGRFTGTGVFKITSLSGIGSRTVVADASGNLSAVPTKITITTSTSITTATTDINEVGQDGKHVIISNGVNAINLTCNGGVTTSYGKVGTGAITFVQGSGRTLVQLSGTAVLSGIAGSTATLWSNGTTDYLAITNY